MNHFDIKARQKERAFVRKLKGQTMFFTGNQKENVIVNVNGDALYVSTAVSKEPFRISRKKLREAMSFLYYKKTATRSDLEVFTSFNSALMGLLRLIFTDIARITRTVKGLLRLTIKGVRFFFSGLDRSSRDMAIAQANGAHFILLSYFWLRQNKSASWYQRVKALGLNVLLDSGAFSIFQAQREGRSVEPIRIEDYMAFIRKYRDVLVGWINLDVVGDAEQTRHNETILTENGLKPIPVWHVQSDWQDLESIVQADHEVIAIGGSAKLSESERGSIYRELFSRYPEQNFHLLGGSSGHLFQFPWFSSDSIAWLYGRRIHKLITPAGHIEKKDWDPMTCLAYNVRHLTGLEETEHYQLALAL